jgi:hypothetical protein
MEFNREGRFRHRAGMVFELARRTILKLRWVAALCSVVLVAGAHAQVSILSGNPDITGVVTSPHGPEAGVWVIAETTDLPTKFAKIVVTDDRGRYLIPELPKANYSVWVRGYGLVDSPKVRATPGSNLNLNAVPAPTAAAAAEYYPPIYWYSMLKIPDKSEFPGSAKNGMAAGMKTQENWLNMVKTNGCITCHAIGDKATRTLPSVFAQSGSVQGWGQRITAGQALRNMVGNIGMMGSDRALKEFADWSDRIKAGALPFAQPPRPQGAERNIVITLWDWSRPTAYLHDEISTDKRNPMVNAYGKLYGSPEESTDFFPVLDPAHFQASEVKHPVRDPKTPTTKDNAHGPSAYWGSDAIWDSQTNIHNPMMDEKSRVWFTARIRGPANPDFCKQGSSHPSAQVFPLATSGRQLSLYDPQTQTFKLISTCYSTHHLVFGEDANQTIWTSGDRNVLGWLNRKLYEETGDEAKAQGWTPFVLDTNGNGKRDDYVEPNQAVDPAKDKRIEAQLYAVEVNPVDGTIWGTVSGFTDYPGYVVRVTLGPDPAHTALTEIYAPPLPGYGPRGGDIDRNGVYWSSLASGHLASFDRSKCKGPLNGPKAATGQQCPEGWTLYPMPGPQFQNVKESGSAESSYFAWVDQFDTLGLGKNVPIATGNLNSSLLALVDGKFVNLYVPYPMSFYAKWLDGRIDDAKAGWKGRGLWATYGTRTLTHLETGKGTTAKVVRFQLRPDPLAR